MISLNLQVKPFAVNYVLMCPSGCVHVGVSCLISGDQMSPAEQMAGVGFDPSQQWTCSVVAVHSSKTELPE